MINELLDIVEDYLNGSTALAHLEIWLLGNLQTILDSRDETSIRMANQIDGDLVELGEGLLDNEVFRERLTGYYNEAKTIHVSIPQELAAASVSTSAASETIKSRMDLRPVVDLFLSHQFA